MAIAWAFWANVMAIMYAWRNDRKGNLDIMLIRIAVALLSLFWFGANTLRWLGALTAAQYFTAVSPFAPLVFIIAWGMPAYISRKRAEIRDKAVKDAETVAKAKLEALFTEVEVDAL